MPGSILGDALLTGVSNFPIILFQWVAGCVGWMVGKAMWTMGLERDQS